MTTLQADLRRAGVDIHDQRTSLLVKKSKDILFSQEILNANNARATASDTKTGALSKAMDSKVQSSSQASHDAHHLLAELPFNIPVKCGSNRNKLPVQVNKGPSGKAKTLSKGPTKRSHTASTSDVADILPIQDVATQNQQDNGDTQPLTPDEKSDDNETVENDAEIHSQEELRHSPANVVADSKPEDPDTDLPTFTPDNSNTEAPELDQKGDNSPPAGDETFEEQSTKDGCLIAEPQVEDNVAVTGSDSDPALGEVPATTETAPAEGDEEASAKMRGLLSRTNTEDSDSTKKSQTDRSISGMDTVNVNLPGISKKGSLGGGSDVPDIPSVLGEEAKPTLEVSGSEEAITGKSGGIDDAQTSQESTIPDIEEVPKPISDSQDRHESKVDEVPQQLESIETYTIPEEEGIGLSHVFPLKQVAQDAASQQSIGGDLCFLDGTLTNYGRAEDFPNAEPVSKPVAQLEDSGESKTNGSPQQRENNEAHFIPEKEGSGPSHFDVDHGHTEGSDPVGDDERGMHDGTFDDPEKDGEASTKGSVETIEPKTMEAKEDTQIGLEKSQKQSYPFVPEKVEFTFRNDHLTSARVEEKKPEENGDHAQVSNAEPNDGTLAVEHSGTATLETTLPNQKEAIVAGESATKVRKYPRFDPQHAAEVIESHTVRLASSQSSSTISSDKRKASTASTNGATVATPATSAAPSPTSSKFQNDPETSAPSPTKKSSKKGKKGKKTKKGKKAGNAKGVTEPQPEPVVSEEEVATGEPEPTAVERETAVPEPEPESMALDWKPANPKTQKRNAQRRRTRARKQEAKKNGDTVETEGAKKA